MARQLVIQLVGESKQFTKALDDAGGATRSFGQRLDSAGRKMSKFVTLPVVGFLGAATKAAVEEEAAMDSLRNTLERTTDGGAKLFDSVEEQIGAFQDLTNFADGETRPVLEKLLLATGDVDESFRLMSAAADLATVSGKDLDSTSQALMRAHMGQFSQLERLGIEVRDTEGKYLSFEEVLGNVTELTGGAAAEATDTAAGKMRTLKNDMGDLTEKIGHVLIPVLAGLIEKLQGVFEWTEQVGVGAETMVVGLLGLAALGPVIRIVSNLATAIRGVGGALAFLSAHPAVLATIATVGALVEGFRMLKDAIDDVKSGVKSIPEAILSPGGILRGNMPNPLDTIRNIWPFQEGGIVTRPTMGLVGEAGPEAIIPLDRAGSLGNTIVVNVTVQGTVTAARDLATEVRDQLAGLERRGARLGFT